jgi:hypothetical protein
MYSAAWLDDGRPGLVSVAGGVGRGILLTVGPGASSASSTRQMEEHEDHGPTAA